MYAGAFGSKPRKFQYQENCNRRMRPLEEVPTPSFIIENKLSISSQQPMDSSHSSSIPQKVHHLDASPSVIEPGEVKSHGEKSTKPVQVGQPVTGVHKYSSWEAFIGARIQEQQGLSSEMAGESPVAREIVAYPKIQPVNGWHGESVRMALFSSPQYGKIDWKAVSQSNKKGSNPCSSPCSYLGKYGVNYKQLKKAPDNGRVSVQNRRKNISSGRLIEGASNHQIFLGQENALVFPQK